MTTQNLTRRKTPPVLGADGLSSLFDKPRPSASGRVTSDGVAESPAAHKTLVTASSFLCSGLFALPYFISELREKGGYGKAICLAVLILFNTSLALISVLAYFNGPFFQRNSKELFLAFQCCAQAPLFFVHYLWPIAGVRDAYYEALFNVLVGVWMAYPLRYGDFDATERRRRRSLARSHLSPRPPLLVVD